MSGPQEQGPGPIFLITLVVDCLTFSFRGPSLVTLSQYCWFIPYPHLHHHLVPISYKVVVVAVVVVVVVATALAPPKEDQRKSTENH